MADNNVKGNETAKAGTEGPHDRKPEVCMAKVESHLETTGTLAPVYQEGGAHDCMSKSDRDLEFVNETMRTDQVQNIFMRLEMVAQDLIQTASGDDAQRLKRSTRAFKSALAWGMGVLKHIGQQCKWPPTVRSEVASRVGEMTKAPLEFAAKRRMQMAPTSWEAECNAHIAWAEMLEFDGLPGVLRGPGDEPDRRGYGAGGVGPREAEG